MSLFFLDLFLFYLSLSLLSLSLLDRESSLYEREMLGATWSQLEAASLSQLETASLSLGEALSPASFWIKKGLSPSVSPTLISLSISLSWEKGSSLYSTARAISLRLKERESETE